MRARQASPDRGFTLIELLITITLLGILAIPVGNAVYQVVKVTSLSAASMTQTADRYRLVRLLDEDVRAANTLDTGVDPCGDAAPATTVLWTTTGDPAANPAPGVRYAVRVRTDGSGLSQLERSTCAGGSPVVPEPEVLAQWRTGDVTVTCQSGCTANPVPDPVQIQIQVRVPAEPGSPDASPLQVTLTRRTS